MAERIIVGVSGASGVMMSMSMLEALRSSGFESHLIITEGARLTWKHEGKMPIEALEALADFVYTETDYDARIASGSYVTRGMIVIPCSMKTLAGIVSGYADNLLLRAADVCLKEGRKVVLVPREMPLGKIHLRNMATAADLGCAIVPPMLTFYNGPESIQAQIDHVIGKVMLQFGVSTETFIPWNGPPQRETT